MSKHLNNTAIFAVETFVLISLTLLTTPFFIHGLGVDIYGVMIFLNIFSVYGALLIFDFGLEGSVINYIARFDALAEPKKIRAVFTSAVLFYFSIGVLLAITFFFTSTLITSGLSEFLSQNQLASIRRALDVIPIIIIVQFSTLAFSSTLEGLRLYSVTRGCNIVVYLIQYPASVVVAGVTGSIANVFLVVLLVSAGRLLFLMCYLFFRVNYFSSFSPRIDNDVTKNLFSYSAILFWSRIISLIFNQMDKFIIWKFLTPSFVAIYDVAVKPASLIRVMITVVNSAVVPEIARLDSISKEEEIKGMFLNLIRYVYILITPMIILLAFNMEYLLKIWVGKELSLYYLSALIVLSIYIVNPIPSIISTMFVGMELVRKIIWISIVGSVVNFFVSIYLVEMYGINGLLIGTLSAEIVMFVPYVFQGSKYFRVPIGSLLKIFATVNAFYLPVLIGALLLRNSEMSFVTLVFSLIVFLGCYVGAYFLLLVKNEQVALKNKFFLMLKVRNSNA